MNKFYLFISATIFVLLTGCSSKGALNHFENDPISANAIQYTQKADLIYEKEIKAMIFATYLNNINKDYASDDIESFLIGIHLVNKENNDFQKEGYTITLNGNSIKSIVEVNKNSALVRSIPLKNNWANYYVAKFKKNETQNLKEEKLELNENQNLTEDKDETSSLKKNKFVKNETRSLKIEFIHSLFGQAQLTFQK